MALIITRYYVLLQKFLLCRKPGGSMANWEHEEGVSQRLTELVTSEQVVWCCVGGGEEGGVRV